MNWIEVKSRCRILSCFFFATLVVLGGCTVPPTEGTVPAEVQQGEETENTESGAGDYVDTSGVPKIDLNNMTREELLATIPEFSNRMVREFFEYRPYISIQQFRREIGKYVDDAQVDFYERYVFVPADINESDAETLKQIPGIDDAIAVALVVGRPFESQEDFLDALSVYIGVEGLAQAA